MILAVQTPPILKKFRKIQKRIAPQRQSQVREMVKDLKQIAKKDINILKKLYSGR